MTFYSEDVFRVWSKWVGQRIEKLRPGIEVKLDEAASLAEEAESTDSVEPNGIDALDVGYNGMKSHLEKTQKALEDVEWRSCTVCHQGLPSGGAMALVCPTKGCSALSHLECLASTFLAADKNEDAMVPTSGNCPGCSAKLQWVDLVKELSLRMRGEKEIEAVFRKRRRTKKQQSASAVGDASESSAEDEVADDPLPEDDNGWHELPDSSDVEEVESARVFPSDPSPPVQRKGCKRQEPTTPQSEPVIEDSDWDEAAVLT